MNDTHPPTASVISAPAEPSSGVALHKQVVPAAKCFESSESSMSAVLAPVTADPSPELVVLSFPELMFPEWAIPMVPESVVPKLVVLPFPELVFCEEAVPEAQEYVVPAVPVVAVPAVPELAVSVVPGSAAGAS